MLVPLTVETIFSSLNTYDNTIIRYGFCDIQNNQGLSESNQPQLSIRPTSTSIILDITKTHPTIAVSYQQCAKKVVLFLQLSRRTLHKAAISGRCDFVKVLLENGEDVDQMDEVARSILRLNVSVFFLFVSEVF